MKNPSPKQCYRILELAPSASPVEIRAAFRRLAKENHPDLNKSRRAQARFMEVTRAYRILQNELNLHPDGSELRLCPQCGRYAELLEGLDGRATCSECLLGQTRRKGFLPPPIWKTAKHLSVVTLYLVSLVLFIKSLKTGDLSYSLYSLAAVMIGLLILAATVFSIQEVKVEPPRKKRRRRRNWRAVWDAAVDLWANVLPLWAKCMLIAGALVLAAVVFAVIYELFAIGFPSEGPIGPQSPDLA
jgi:hypothetical protein